MLRFRSRPSITGLFAAAVVFGLTATGNGVADDNTAPHRLVFLDGRQITATILGINAQGAITLSKQSTTVSLNDLRSIAPVKPPAKIESGVVQVGLLADGVLRAKTITVKNEKFLIDGGFAAGRSLSLETVRFVLLADKADEAFTKALASPSEEADRLIVKLRGKLRTISALTESLNAETATVSLDNRSTTIPRSDVHGIVFAYVKKPFDRNGLCRVRLNDGSVLSCRIVGLSNGKLSLRLVGGVELAVPWAAVVDISITSDRLQFLSDLTPTDVTEQAIVAFPRKWQKDKSVTGSTLSVGSTTFKKGIGVHARSRLTFAADGQFQTFAATIGLDDAAGGKGDCVFVVLSDGRELFRKRVKGRDKPLPIRVDIKGVRNLVLLVEPGENLDIADHADWCDAIVIRPAK